MEKRFKLYCSMIEEIDEAYRLMAEYDALPHDYGSATLYQAESQIIHQVGDHPGITASELSVRLKKTMSACSQLVKKLRNKGIIIQTRSESNNRLYNLNLSEAGQRIYQDHSAFELRCYTRTFRELDDFSMEDFQTFISILRRINASFAMDVEESRMVSFQNSEEQE